MNKVTTINLNGKAYQLEEAGYELLQKYLGQARKNLADDPDKDEIVADFERAIAEKCDAYLHGRKNVIGEKEVKKIIDDMGPVEPADEGKPKSDGNEESAGDSTRGKRLYTLREGAVIGGVCNGLAAYLNVDVTVVRLVFVMLAFVSSGFWILAYLVGMLVIPEARTPEERAELRGEKFSAQDVLKRAKEKYAEAGVDEKLRAAADNARPALSNAGQTLLRLLRAVCAIIALLIGVGVAGLTAAWLGGLWWLIFSSPHFTDQLSTIPLWSIAVGGTALYFVMALPMLMAIYLLSQVSKGYDSEKRPSRWPWLVGGLWIAALAALIGFGISISGRLSDYQATHGYLMIDGHNICINDNFCSGDPQFKSVPQPPQPLPYHPYRYY